MVLKRQIIYDTQPFCHVKKQIERASRREGGEDAESVVIFTQVPPLQCSSSDLEAGLNTFMAQRPSSQQKKFAGNKRRIYRVFFAEALYLTSLIYQFVF